MFDSIFLNPNGAKGMLQGMYDLLEEADVVVHYNGTKFDMPILNQEFAIHGFTPPSSYKQVDLLKTARRQFRLISNKMDYVAQVFGLEGKKAHKGLSLWFECAEGNPKSWKQMEGYNKQDVRVLKTLYKVLLPWIKDHPNAAVYDEERPADRHRCPTCGSHHVQARGYYVAKTGKYQRYRCNKCGTWSRSIKMIREDRTNILVKDNG